MSLNEAEDAQYANRRIEICFSAIDNPEKRSFVKRKKKKKRGNKNLSPLEKCLTPFLTADAIIQDESVIIG